MKNTREVFTIYATPTPEEFECIITGALPVIARGGVAIPHRLTQAQRALLAEAQAQRYLSVASGKEENEALENAFHLWCDMRGLPYARVRPRRTQGDVTLDFIHIPRARLFSPAITAQADRFLDAFALKAGWPAKTRVHISLATGYWYVSSVPLAFADEMVRGLVEIAAQALAATSDATPEGGAQ